LGLEIEVTDRGSAIVIILSGGTDRLGRIRPGTAALTLGSPAMTEMPNEAPIDTPQ
jgi:hypothetical protein